MTKNNMSFCFRCYHTWKRRKEKPPKVCPKCKSPYWSKPRKRVSKQFLLNMVDTIIHLHDAIIKLSGGEKGIRDEGGIHNSTYKLLIHQNKNQKKPISIGAFTLNEFAKRHYFIDGNKRTAYVLAKVFMLINKCHLKTEYPKALNFILDVAKHNSKLTLDDIKDWLSKNCIIVEEKDAESYLKELAFNLLSEENENE